MSINFVGKTLERTLSIDRVSKICWNLANAEQVSAANHAGLCNNTACLELLLNAKGDPNQPNGDDPLVRPRSDPCIYGKA